MEWLHKFEREWNDTDTLQSEVRTGYTEYRSRILPLELAILLNIQGNINICDQVINNRACEIKCDAIQDV